MTETLDILWASFDTPMPLFTAEAESAWPVGMSYELASMGILVSTDNASQVVCPACSQRHVEEIVARPGADGVVRHFIYCPEALRVEVPNSIVCQRTWNHTRIAEVMAGGLTLSGNCKALVPDRLWRLGKLASDTSREVMLARGLAWQDGMNIAKKIDGKAIVLVAQHPPALWSGRTPALIPLARVTHFQSHRIAFDVAHMWSLVHEADKAAEAAQILPLDAVSAKKVRRHVNDTIKSMVSNEALVQAYRTHNSYRKTADVLNSEGYSTDRWAVERAVKAAGGPKAVKNGDDSGSVARTVASQSRDRAKKIIERR